MPNLEHGLNSSMFRGKTVVSSLHGSPTIRSLPVVFVQRGSILSSDGQTSGKAV